MEKKYAISSGSSVEWVEEDSYFFKLSTWQKNSLRFYRDNPNFIRLNQEKTRL